MIGNKKYNIALIGAGRMGARWAGVIASSRQASLALVVDTDEALARQVAALHGAKASTDRKEAFGAGIDAVCIVTPHTFLYPLAKEALLSGKHVLVEKPGSRTKAEMQDLLALSREKKLAFMVGFNYRFFDSIRQAKETAQSGAIGDVCKVRIVHGHPGRPGYEKEWRMDKELAGGGVLMDQGLHCIDLARWFLPGTITRISGTTSNEIWKTAVEDSAALILTTGKSRTASISVSISEWKPVFSLVVSGTKGYISLPGLGRKYGNGESFSVGIYDRKAEKLEERTIPCDPDADKALALELEAFLDNVALRSPENQTAVDAAEVLRIIEEVYAQQTKA